MLIRFPAAFALPVRILPVPFTVIPFSPELAPAERLFPRVVEFWLVAVRFVPTQRAQVEAGKVRLERSMFPKVGAKRFKSVIKPCESMIVVSITFVTFMAAFASPVAIEAVELSMLFMVLVEEVCVELGVVMVLDAVEEAPVDDSSVEDEVVEEATERGVELLSGVDVEVEVDVEEGVEEAVEVVSSARTIGIARPYAAMRAMASTAGRIFACFIFKINILFIGLLMMIEYPVKNSSEEIAKFDNERYAWRRGGGHYRNGGRRKDSCSDRGPFDIYGRDEVDRFRSFDLVPSVDLYGSAGRGVAHC